MYIKIIYFEKVKGVDFTIAVLCIPYIDEIFIFKFKDDDYLLGVWKECFWQRLLSLSLLLMLPEE